jgi:hypothetical protein
MEILTTGTQKSLTTATEREILQWKEVEEAAVKNRRPTPMPIRTEMSEFARQP